MSKLQDFWVEGTITAPLTPFKKNGDLNPDILDKYVDFLVNNKIDGVFAAGTMGEGMSLTVAERKQAAESWVRACRNKLKYVIVQVGTENLRSSKELAQHCQQVGVTAIACLAPSYVKPDSVDALVDYMEQVAASAPDLPFYLYDINFMTGIYLNSAEFLEKAGSRIPNLRGLKFSCRELPYLLDCKSCCGGKFQVMLGSDEQFLTALSIGVDVPVLNGYIGPTFDKLRTAFRNGDMDTAQQQQKFARQLARITAKHGGGIPAVKAIMELLGLDLGPVRLPLLPITAQQKEGLKRDLQNIGFL
ncbi:N-acetylneuraminate lyase-like [Haliotis cracherodii]|uniref:N-acetylneuraminate lyase-like n=1 Tax=Haliotis cracherodii TaxID=6455 RepID=UPI0039ECB9B5